MAWNGSQNSAGMKPIKIVTKDGREIRGKRPAVARGLVAGLSVVILGVIVLALFLQPTSEAPTEEREAKPQKAIADVTPIEMPKEVSELPPAPKPIDPNARPTKVGEVVNGYVMLPSGRIHKRQGVVTNTASAKLAKSPYSIFDNRCENEIANLLMMKPGQTPLGTPHYGWFEKNFLNSIKSPIIISKDDTPEQAELKRAVIDAKLQLKDAYDRGEDITQIMLETRQELQDLGRYKSELRKTYLTALKDCETQEDVDSLREACNRMLEEKGIEPLKFTPLTRRNLMMRKDD